MATATRTIPAPAGHIGAHRAPAVARQRAAAVPVIRRRGRNRLIIACCALFVFALGYIGSYALLTHYGNRRAELSRQIRLAEMENQALKARIEALASPESLAAYAAATGMVPSAKVVYLPAQDRVRVAKAE